MGDDGLRALVGGLHREAAELVEEAIARDVNKKRGEGRAALVATGAPVQPHEDLEGEVLGLGQGAERAVEKGGERFLPVVEQLLPRALVAGGAAGEAVGVRARRGGPCPRAPDQAAAAPGTRSSPPKGTGNARAKFTGRTNPGDGRILPAGRKKRTGSAAAGGGEIPGRLGRRRPSAEQNRRRGAGEPSMGGAGNAGWGSVSGRALKDGRVASTLVTFAFKQRRTWGGRQEPACRRGCRCHGSPDPCFGNHGSGDPCHEIACEQAPPSRQVSRSLDVSRNSRGRLLGRGTAREIHRATCSGRENSFRFSA